LGKPVRVRGHPGWTGHVATSYDAEPEYAPAPAPPPVAPTTPSIYDGREQVLYWSDASNEIAFVVPSGYEVEEDDKQSDIVKNDTDGSCLSTSSEKAAGSCWDVSSNSSGAPSYERSISESDKGERGRSSLNEKVRALSLDLDKQPGAQGLTGSGRRNRDFTTKILIFWLEDFEDHLNLPIDDLLRYCETGQPWRRHEVVVYSVGARASGLVRVAAARAGARCAPARNWRPRCCPPACAAPPRMRTTHTDTPPSCEYTAAARAGGALCATGARCCPPACAAGPRMRTTHTATPPSLSTTAAARAGARCAPARNWRPRCCPPACARARACAPRTPPHHRAVSTPRRARGGALCAGAQLAPALLPACLRRAARMRTTHTATPPSCEYTAARARAGARCAPARNWRPRCCPPACAAPPRMRTTHTATPPSCEYTARRARGARCAPARNWRPRCCPPACAAPPRMRTTHTATPPSCTSRPTCGAAS
ncbi:hypothetical protein MSG28_012474, partial [Choristoneura fumiferana]